MRILALLLLPLAAFADVMITPAVMVDLRLAETMQAPVVASVDYSATTAATPTNVVDGYQWYSMPYTVSLEGYVDSTDVAKSLDVNAGAILYDSIEKTNILFMIDDASQVRLLDMEKGMGHVRFEGELTVYFPREVAAAPAQEATMEEFADVMEEETPVVEVAPVEDSSFIQERVVYEAPTMTRPAPASMRSVEGRLLVKKNPFGKKIYLTDARTGHKIARINPKSPVGMVNLERYNNKVVILVGTLEEKRGSLSLTVRTIRLR